MTLMQSAGRSERLIERAKHHPEGSVERSVEPANWISKGPGMLGDGGCHPRVSQLEQQGAAGAKEDGRLAVDPPSQVSETGPKTPSIAPAAASRTVSRLLSKSSSDNNKFILTIRNGMMGRQAHRIQVRALYSVVIVGRQPRLSGLDLAYAKAHLSLILNDRRRWMEQIIDGSAVH
jgi:hypothetical protein